MEGPFRVVDIFSPAAYRIVHCSNLCWKRTAHFNRLKPAPMPDTDNEEFEEEHVDSEVDTQGRDVNTRRRDVNVKSTDDEASATPEPNVGDEVPSDDEVSATPEPNIGDEVPI